MIEKALLTVLVALALTFGAVRLGSELKETFCDAAAAMADGQCKE